jgi:hypothetical protein
VAWWRGETHQYLNISTHPLRVDTPKEEQKNKGMTEKEKNDHSLDPNIPKDQGRNDQPKNLQNTEELQEESDWHSQEWLTVERMMANPKS